ncbi:hypothetical protein M438DRAFT_408088 [Aureobasidium pullulans EXF-150]|uniref:Uncharacterized protein n=1 Tax=Aureobasidium pullulans EXF-150 TaxID=1043002 RepID=A0A074XC68_AURPU|nr:uncharacterized protein M438DRAFT_408088 [Aureobasidium pullulans EXF-150]KEQ81334.1 hypothetical protein M438DRAFT_408088 [Aureobasidium pullulans EXF-150]
MNRNGQINPPRPSTRNASVRALAEISASRAARCEALDHRNFLLDHEDVGYYMQASVEEAARRINEAAGATVTNVIHLLNRSAAAAVAQMTAEFAPVAARTKALVAGVASSREVQAINTAFGLAVDKTEKLQKELEEVKKLLAEEKQKREELEKKVEEMCEWMKMNA